MLMNNCGILDPQTHRTKNNLLTIFIYIDNCLQSMYEIFSYDIGVYCNCQLYFYCACYVSGSRYDFGGVLESKLLTRSVGKNHEEYFPITQYIT